MSISLTEQRARWPYLGKPRNTATLDKDGWTLRPDGSKARAVAFDQPRDQRAFAAPDWATLWTVDDQVAAVDRGFFVERFIPPDVSGNLGADNHARIIPLHTHESDAAIITCAERVAEAGDPFALKLLAFVKQQDEYGYSGTW